MRHTLLIFAAAAGVALTGCFDNHGRPDDATPVTSLAALAATNRAEVVRLYLRGTAEKLTGEALTDLPSLRELDLSERHLDAVPKEVFALTTLERFWFARNQLTNAVPAELAQLPALAYLNLDGNRLTSVPDALGGAKALRFLRLNDNLLAALPDALGGLKELRRLYAKNNRLAAVPAFLKDCPNIEDVLLDGNPIAEVPDWLTKMPTLKSVSFTGCRIAKLPDDLTGWRRLDSLSLAGCPIPEVEMKRVRAALGDDVAVTF